MNAKLKLNSRDTVMEVDNAVSEKSKYLFYFLNTQIRTFYYYFLFVFIVPRIDDQIFTLEPLAEHVSSTYNYFYS